MSKNLHLREVHELPKTAKKWPDRVLALCTIGLCIGLLPVVFTPEAMMPLASSIPTSFLLYVMAGTLYAVGGLGLSAVTTAMTASLWAFIAFFRHG